MLSNDNIGNLTNCCARKYALELRLSRRKKLQSRFSLTCLMIFEDLAEVARRQNIKVRIFQPAEADMKSEIRNRKELSPERLPEKLRQIRQNAQLTQGAMLRIVNPVEKSEHNRARISQYESGLRVPSIVEIHNYAKFAQVNIETLTDDQLNLPVIINRGTNLYKKGEKQSARRGVKRVELKSTYNQPSTSDSEPESDSSSETTKSFSHSSSQTMPKSSPQNIVHTDGATSTQWMPLSEEILRDCKAVYLEILSNLPFEKMSRLTPDIFIEQMLKVALNDYKSRRIESAIACRVRSLIEE